MVNLFDVRTSFLFFSFFFFFFFFFFFHDTVCNIGELLDHPQIEFLNKTFDFLMECASFTLW